MKNKNNFENNIEMLKKIVEKLENENNNLEDSLVEFEKGIKLYNECNQILKNAENKIQILNEKLEN